jgi:HlyD family secretion protein
MKYTLFKTFSLAVLLGGGFLAIPPLQDLWKMHNATNFRTAEVKEGKLVSFVNATGTVTPVVSVRVGSFASGPVTRLYVDYNTPVKKDALLAEIDPTLYEAARDRDAADLRRAECEVARVSALLEQAKADEQRSLKIRAGGAGFVAQEELDRVRYTRVSYEAQLKVAVAQIEVARANLASSEKTLTYTKIRSPVDGIVIDRKIELGQTLAAQFMIPDLFLVAQDLEKEIHIYATIDEADVASIKEAKKRNLPVHFTVDAHPYELFTGEIVAIRYNSTVKENVVTYTVVVSFKKNRGEKILPGMTAKLSFEIEEREGALEVPNAALRFYPRAEHVCPADRGLVDGTGVSNDTDSNDPTADNRSAVQRAFDRRQSKHRHVWVKGPDGLHAIKVETGISDDQHTEVVRVLGGQLVAGAEVVTGVKK